MIVLSIFYCEIFKIITHDNDSSDEQFKYFRLFLFHRLGRCPPTSLKRWLNVKIKFFDSFNVTLAHHIYPQESWILYFPSTRRDICNPLPFSEQIQISSSFFIFLSLLPSSSLCLAYVLRKRKKNVLIRRRHLPLFKVWFSILCWCWLMLERSKSHSCSWLKVRNGRGSWKFCTRLLEIITLTLLST